jgi:hypothetical protein
MVRPMRSRTVDAMTKRSSASPPSSRPDPHALRSTGSAGHLAEVFAGEVVANITNTVAVGGAAAADERRRGHLQHLHAAHRLLTDSATASEPATT